ncbi:ABC transporter ATP-binding protein [Mediterraneibacter catenae]|uniref:ABC transporter ATP-binding protein n=2 Tax=Lachnospiraceae TaxID=186803 RepID=A0A5M9I1Z6_9FIRM|nr:ABC transporter ATP-binding protein [Mediterraneibacter glycyrrhizinilyticus]KAA8501856.1 ABC transporter ATP-binding protein [Mediterraneibacter catenae]OUO27101.1 ABC transporter [Lachnoclostridium sp. An298]HJA19005.1 ABC transporter ATP-binding protein [Candidatus Mediterraneibacter ornithocaccae]MCF2569211.1 ABC transporter ATP-binding protein [Mediterraneibacter glycyrrhizinilyticus]MDN0060920.1 ABC transporter ATP-binding protein [Mediterraneibacter glycyrrhizinilyticus]
MNAIQTDGLTKFYGRSRGIIELDLEVHEGEFYGFIGPNGAGKSTTIRILMGLIHKTRGSARILGKDISKEKEQILSVTGYLPSEAVFYPDMRGRDLIRLSADLRRKDCRKTSSDLCERLQLDPSRRISELSFGNRKKLAVVCALQHDPQICILDEPTGGLDPLMQREFFEILKERNKKGMTVFLSSHILSEVQRFCSRAAIIREGRIIASGSVEELTRTNAKRVTVRGTFDPSGLPDVRDLQISGDMVSFLYGGDINLLLSRLSRHQIMDLSLSEPDLEEIFLHYYTEGDEKE